MNLVPDIENILEQGVDFLVGFGVIPEPLEARGLLCVSENRVIVIPKMVFIEDRQQRYDFTYINWLGNCSISCNS